MNIVQISTYGTSGGAAIAARRLHLGLLEAGENSRFVVADLPGDTRNTTLLGGRLTRKILRPLGQRLEQLLIGFFPRPAHPSYTTFSLMPSLWSYRINAIPKDILHLHWIGEGFLSPTALGGLHGPIVWTIHDTWPFTGGCHFQITGCDRYKRQCGCCPELCSSHNYDLSRIHWKIKKRAIQKIKPTIVSPSKEYAHCAAASGLLKNCRIEYIPNGIDTTVFHPIEKNFAKEILGLPQKDSIILFGAVSTNKDYNKGFDLLKEAVQYIDDKEKKSMIAVIFGSSYTNISFPCPVKPLGQLHDPVSLALAYSAADVFVCPSRQENLPNTIMEAMACGTPVVAFSVGGIPDMVEHGTTGYLARPYDTQDLANGISRLLGDKNKIQYMGNACISKVKNEFSIQIVSQKYINLYKDILNNNQ